MINDSIQAKLGYVGSDKSMPLYRELQRKTQQLKYSAKVAYMVAIGDTTKIATCLGWKVPKKKNLHKI